VSETFDEDLLEDVDDDIVSRRSSSHPHKGWGRGWVIAAVVIGVVIGVWMAGRPADSTTDAPVVDPPVTAEPTYDPSVRQAELEDWLAQHPEDADAHLELGVILFNLDDLDGAKDEWTRVTELDPTSARAWYNLGFYYLYQDPPDYDMAREVWNTVVQLDPNSDLASTVLTHMTGLPESTETGG